MEKQLVAAFLFLVFLWLTTIGAWFHLAPIWLIPTFFTIVAVSVGVAFLFNED